MQLTLIPLLLDLDPHRPVHGEPEVGGAVERGRGGGVEGSNILCLPKVSGGSWVWNVYGMLSGGVEVGCEVGVQSLVDGIVGTMKLRRQRCCWKIVHM